jgi:diguanylate cyclase (GGDEF)-like protein
LSDSAASRSSGQGWSVIRRWLGMSLATRSAIALSLALAALLLVLAAIVYWQGREGGEAEALAALQEYNERVINEQRMSFQRISAAHAAAERTMKREMAGLTDADTDRLYDALFPEQADGTRRSAPYLFNGGIGPTGYVEGIGAYIPPGDAIEKRTAIAAVRAVYAIGVGARFDLESLYFFTPSNALFIFAPDRADQLLYYRQEAPADLDFQDEEFAQVSVPANNPAGVMKCTSLQPVVYDQADTTWTSGCFSPVSIDGAYSGAFGTTIFLQDIVPETRTDADPTSKTVIVSGEGRLVSHPDFTRQNSAETGRRLNLTVAEEPELQALWAFLRAQGTSSFTGMAPELGAAVSMEYLQAPGWYVLTLRPQDAVEAQAISLALDILRIGAIAIALALLITVIVVRRTISAPMQALVSRIDDMQRRVRPNADTERGAESSSELRRILKRFTRMSDDVIEAQNNLEETIKTRTEELREANRQLRLISEHDALTDIPNRRFIMKHLAEQLQMRGGAPGTGLLIVDIDQFKSVNDRYGHPAGDDVLKTVARRLSRSLRDGDRIGRIGGEEFLIVLKTGSEAALAASGDRICAVISADPIVLESGKPLAITVSVGGALGREHDDVDSLFGRADKRLYLAKDNGRNRAVCSTEKAEELESGHRAA